MYEVTMPKLSDSMEEGKIIEWKVKEGDAVKEGQVIADVESDKAVMELECFHDGVIAKINKGDGAEVTVGEVIALIDAAESVTAEQSEGKPAPKKQEEPAPAQSEAAPKKVEKPGKKARKAAPPTREEAVEAKPEEVGESEQEGVEEKAAPSEPRPKPAKGAKPREAAKTEPSEAAKTEPKPAPRETAKTEPKPTPRKPTATAATVSAAERLPISPYAKKLAADLGIDYSLLRGSGEGGRIVAADIELAAKFLKPAAPKPEPPPRKPSPDEELPALELEPGEADVEDASFRLKTQARRVTNAKHVIPHFYLTRGADVTALLARKDELKARHGATITHLIMLACIKAIERNPAVNRSYDRGKIIKWNGINLGLAVATDDGLTVAVLRDAQALSFADLVARSKDLVERARNGRLSAAERRHPGLTITNLGMFDVEHFEPIINPPSSITLAVASALPDTIVRNGEIFIGHTMKLTASCDHRIVDGVTGAKFVASLVALLEKPDELLG